MYRTKLEREYQEYHNSYEFEEQEDSPQPEEMVRCVSCWDIFESDDQPIITVDGPVHSDCYRDYVVNLLDEMGFHAGFDPQRCEDDLEELYCSVTGRKWGT